MLDDAFAKFVKDHAAHLDALVDSTGPPPSLAGRLAGETQRDTFLRTAVGLHMDFQRPVESLGHIEEAFALLDSGVLELPDSVLDHTGTTQETLIDTYAMDLGADTAVYKTLQDCAAAWATRANVALHASAIGAADVPGTLALLDANAGLRRPPSGLTQVVVLEPWHPGVLDFISAADSRFLGRTLWLPDGFMRAVNNNAQWHLFDPVKARALADVCDTTFDEMYTRFAAEGGGGASLGRVQARDLWAHLIMNRVPVGFKDAVNRANPVSFSGVVKSGGCCGTSLSLGGTACHASVVRGYIRGDLLLQQSSIEHDYYAALHQSAKAAVRTLDRVIDVAVYATVEGRSYAEALRPVGLQLKGSEDAAAWEALYHGALEGSVELSRELGSYFCFKGSAAACGQVAFDTRPTPPSLSGTWDWDDLRQKMRAGMRNACVTAGPVDVVVDAPEGFAHLEYLAFVDQPLAVTLKHPGDNISASHFLATAWKSGLPLGGVRWMSDDDDGAAEALAAGKKKMPESMAAGATTRNQSHETF